MEISVFYGNGLHVGLERRLELMTAILLKEGVCENP